MPLRPRLPSTLRARRDYVWFRLERDWPFVLSLLGLAFGAVSLLAEVLPGATPKIVLSAITCVGFAFSAVTFRRDTRHQRRIAGPIVVTARTAALPAIVPSPLYDGAYVVTHSQLGEAIVHDGADALLDRSDAAAEWSADSFRLGEDLRSTAVQTIGERVRRREVVFNGPAVRLASDIVPATLAEGVVTVQRARYFDNVCSNHLTRSSVRLQGAPARLGESFFARYVADPHGALRDLGGQSRLANVIGISTLAFTTDDLLVVVNQSARSGASRELLAPSGSGSLEPRDAGPRGAGSLRELVVRGMERELREECNPGAEVRMTTRVTGFARWMEYGGKPEFFGVTRIHDLDGAALLSRRTIRGERIFVTAVATVAIDLEALAHAAAVRDLEALLPLLADDVGEGASMPLLLALHALGRRLRQDRDFLPAAGN